MGDFYVVSSNDVRATRERSQSSQPGEMGLVLRRFELPQKQLS